MKENNSKKVFVKKIFNDVAKKYDLMNDLMSIGLHRSWKRKFINEIKLKNKKNKILDLGSGTGDIILELIKKNKIVNSENLIILSDPNIKMIKESFKKFNNAKNIYNVANYGEELPFKSNQFDLVTMSFSLRNTYNLKKTIKEINRVLKKNSQFLCLEFGKISNPVINEIYQIYSQNFIPKIGSFVAENQDAYEYLIQSIKKFPDQKKLSNILKLNGFKNVSFKNLAFGIVAIYVCNK